MLCLSARFVYFGRMLTLDSLLCFWVVASWAAGHVALFKGKLSRAWWCLSALACGLGLLTKGPVALALVVPPLFALQLFDSRVARPSLKSWGLFVAVALGVALPWAVLASWQDAQFLPEFIWTHNILRFVSPIDHEEPFWFYLPGLLLGMLPWTLLLPSTIKFLLRRSATSDARRPAGMGFFCLAAIWSLVFFSAAGCKRPGYILPVMPPLALAIGCYLNAALPRRARDRPCHTVGSTAIPSSSRDAPDLGIGNCSQRCRHDRRIAKINSWASHVRGGSGHSDLFVTQGSQSPRLDFVESPGRDDVHPDPGGLARRHAKLRANSPSRRRCVRNAASPKIPRFR